MPKRFCATASSRHRMTTARAHMFLFADDRARAFMAVVPECLRRMLEVAFLLRSLRRRHCWGKVDEPLRVCGEPAHHFQSGRGIFFANRYRAMQSGADDPFSKDVINIEKLIMM